MMRKKAALHLESRYTTMIENAYYYCNPPETQAVARKVRPPMHEYIRRLLYKDLSKVTTEKVSVQGHHGEDQCSRSPQRRSVSKVIREKISAWGVTWCQTGYPCEKTVFRIGPFWSCDRS
jgi:hypothetical protein